MINKFKSVYAERPNQSLEIIPVDDGVRISVDHGSDGAYGIIVSQTNAPAISLATLESAGFVESSGGSANEVAHHFGMAMLHLRMGIEEQERVIAEAREQKELEAEALELFNTFWRSDGEDPSSIENWRVPSNEREDWIAVARRARELREDK